MGAESRPWRTSSLVAEAATAINGKRKAARGCGLFVSPRTFCGRHISRAVLPATDVCLCIAGICPPPRRPSSRRHACLCVGRPGDRIRLATGPQADESYATVAVVGSTAWSWVPVIAELCPSRNRWPPKDDGNSLGRPSPKGRAAEGRASAARASARRGGTGICSPRADRGASGWEVGGGCAAVLGKVACRGAGDLRDRHYPRVP
jgi:hypothetical protein